MKSLLTILCLLFLDFQTMGQEADSTVEKVVINEYSTVSHGGSIQKSNESVEFSNEETVTLDSAITDELQKEAARQQADSTAENRQFEEKITQTEVTGSTDKKEPTDREEIINQFEPYIEWWGGVVLGIILVLILIFHLMYPIIKLKNPYSNQTMGFPPATIRGILTLSLAYFIILLEYYRFLYPANLGEFSGQLISGFEIMLGFYFGGKVLQGLSESDNDKTAKVAEAAKEQATKTAETKAAQSQAVAEQAAASAVAQEQTARMQLLTQNQNPDLASSMFDAGAEG